MLNICGCLVEALPDKAARVAAEISAIEGAEVHAREGGRIVVTAEDTASRRASELIMQMHQVPGVLTVTLTCHYFESPEDASQAAEPI